MASSVLGLHHVTAIAGDPQQNIDFYTQVLGLRLVKVTVDVHDPEAYHLVYGAGTGQPGTLLGFHCWPGAIQGRAGTGQIHGAALDIPPGSLEYWHDRLTSNNVAADGHHQRDGVRSLSFRDPDGLMLALVVDAAAPTWDAPSWGSIPVERAIRGLHGITIWAESGGQWARLLATALGLDVVAKDADVDRYSVHRQGVGARVDVRVMPGVGRGLTAVGCIDHAAFRVSDHELHSWCSRLAAHAESVGSVEDHVYYRAVRIEGPEGVRLELASDGPGVTVDEAPKELGTHLALPPWLEAQRSYLEQRLPPLRLPGAMR